MGRGRDTKQKEQTSGSQAWSRMGYWSKYTPSAVDLSVLGMLGVIQDNADSSLRTQGQKVN